MDSRLNLSDRQRDLPTAATVESRDSANWAAKMFAFRRLSSIVVSVRGGAAVSRSISIASRENMRLVQFQIQESQK